MENKENLAKYAKQILEQIGIQLVRRISAIELAIEVLQKPIREIDAHQAVLNCIPVTCTELRNELEEKALSIYLNKRKEVLAEIFQRSLPILKKQMLEYLK